MVQQILRRALGVVKDQASIGLARVSRSRLSSRVPALEIAIVKATSHNEQVPVTDKHVREIIQIMAFSRGYSGACVAVLARRLSRTQNWVVALKVLLLIHRLLLQDSSVVDSSFDDELMLASRRMLSLSGFKDESKHPLALKCSAFVRNYALYIDEWLDCFVLGAASEQSDANLVQAAAASSMVVDYNDYRMDYSTYKQDEFHLVPGESQQLPRRGIFSETMKQAEGGAAIAKNECASGNDVKVGMLLNRLPVLQHLLEHVLGCSSGASIQHSLVRGALTLIVRDSFRVYADVCDGVSTLLNEFFLMVHRDGLKAFAIYSILAKQVDALAELYERCRELGICGDAEYPSIQRVSREHLVLLDDYLKDTRKMGSAGLEEPKMDHPQEPKMEEPQQPKMEEPQEPRKVPRARILSGEIAPIVIEDKDKQEVDLIKFDEEGARQESFTLPLFSSDGTEESSWELFGSSSEEGAVTAAEAALKAVVATPTKSNYPDHDGSEDWEAALMNEASKLSYSLSKGRSTSLGLMDWHTSNSSKSVNSSRKVRSRLSLLSMPAMRATTESFMFGGFLREDSNHGLKQQQLKKNSAGMVGIGSPGSYGKLMNKHPHGYRHLLVQNSR